MLVWGRRDGRRIVTYGAGGLAREVLGDDKAGGNEGESELHCERCVVVVSITRY